MRGNLEKSNNNNLPFDLEDDFHNDLYPLKADCIYPISIGQAYHYGDKLKAAAGEANRKQYKYVVFMRACVLQRWSLMINNPELTEKGAWDLALQKGKEWETINADAFSILKADVHHRILPWELWLEHPLYNDCQKALIDACSANTQLRESFNSTLETFVERHKKENPNIDEERCRDLSSRYLYEEGAVFLLWAKYNYKEMAYPKKLSLFMEQIYLQMIYPQNPLILVRHNINLKREQKRQSLAHNLSETGLFKPQPSTAEMEIMFAKVILSVTKAAISEVNISEERLPNFQRYLKSELNSYIDSLGNRYVKSNSI